MADLSYLHLNPESDVPLYKQLAESIVNAIGRGDLHPADRLPATRELAGQLGLNRTTISAAYALLEETGFIEGHVGRGSFVAKREKAPAPSTTDWEAILPPLEAPLPSPHKIDISFANSRPAAEEFPLAEFRRLSKQVIDSPEAAQILQLGSPLGYPLLRRYLLDRALASGVARSGDDLIVTNGCQQAFDLLAHLFASGGQTAVLEDPVYHGLVRVFSRAGAHIVPVPVDDNGLDVDALEKAIERTHPRLVVVTPSFQNPTGATLSLERRKRLVELARRSGAVLVENDIYSELRYRGKPLPTLKELDETGNTILLRSYSKVAFPGLRVGWIIAPRAVVARLAEAKQTSDLHSDQLAQAILLRFAESGELALHLERTRRAGAERLQTVLRGCAQYLPPGTRFTHPEGGMSLWIELPAPLTAESLLARVEERGISFLAGRHFSADHRHIRGLRISFGALPPARILRGLQIIGEAAETELAASRAPERFEAIAALV